MKAKVFNEEKLIREKMKKMASAHDTKVIQSFVIFIMVGDCFCREKFLNPFSSQVTEMSDKLRSMQAELAKLRKTDNNNTQKRKTNSTNLFHDKNKKVAKVASRTASPLSRSTYHPENNIRLLYPRSENK